MSALISVPPIGNAPIVPCINDEGSQIRHELLLKCEQVAGVIDETSRDLAIRIAGEIKAHLKVVEASRVAIKEPFLKMGREIDAVAKLHTAELDAELRRLNGLSGAFEQDRQRKIQAEEARMRAEQARVVEDARKAQQEALRLAEEARKKEEQFAAKGKEPSDAQKAKNLEAQLEADEAAEKARQEIARLEHDRTLAQQQAISAKPTGGSLREEIDLECYDLHALYKDCPQAVKLTPDVVFLKGMAKRGIKYAGVAYTPRAEFRTRAS